EVAALAQEPVLRTVVWLDELQRYLDGEHGLTGGMIRALLKPPHPAVIIGTLWPELYSAYTALSAPGADRLLAAIQGERRWRGCVFAGERGFRGGSGCGGVACDDTVSVSDKGRPSPLPFCRSPGRAVRVLGGTIAHGRQQRGRRRVASR
ncbi:MAG TPA: hypothetical protein VII22_15180, partial [Streptosporangiaceae bacterium]